jgi:hypothetical protein
MPIKSFINKYKWILLLATVSIFSMLYLALSTNPNSKNKSTSPYVTPTKSPNQGVVVLPNDPIQLTSTNFTSGENQLMFSTTALEFQFNFEIDPASISYSIFPYIAAKSYVTQPPGTKFSIFPPSGWVEKTTYIITINTLKSRYGNHALSKPLQFSFTPVYAKTYTDPVP